MPFSSPSVIAKFKDVPCIFYDASGCVRNKSSHGIPLLRICGVFATTKKAGIKLNYFSIRGTYGFEGRFIK